MQEFDCKEKYYSIIVDIWSLLVAPFVAEKHVI